MPPKNKKQLEEEAKRLEEEQRKKEEEQRRLAEEQRKKYAVQKLEPTQLALPITDQLIQDLFSKGSAHINQKLKANFHEEYPALDSNPKLERQILKQMQYVLKNACYLFGVHSEKEAQFVASTDQKADSKLQKIRVICGIFLKVFLNNHPGVQPPQSQPSQNQADKENQNNQPQIQAVAKSRREDEQLLKELILNHSQAKNPTKQLKVFSQGELKQVLGFFKSNYFDHYVVIHRYCEFSPKRQDTKVQNIYLSTPSVEFNDHETVFVDLSGNQQPEDHNKEEEQSGLNKEDS